MGFEGRGLLNPHGRTFRYREHYTISDDIVKGLVLGAFLLVGCVFNSNKSKKAKPRRKPITIDEQREFEMRRLFLAQSFDFPKCVILYVLLYLFAIASPILGAILYCYAGWWMFFSVLVFGVIELSFVVLSTMELVCKMSGGWIFNVQNKEKQIKQTKVLEFLSIIVNVILIVINSYPFIVPYEGGLLVTLMVIGLYFVNIFSIYAIIVEFKAFYSQFEQNYICENKQQDSINIYEIAKQQPIRQEEIIYDNTEKIYQFQNKCNNEQISIAVIKANIRLSTAMIDCYKKGCSKLSYKRIQEELKNKIELAKRDFVKRECKLAIEIIDLLKEKDVDQVVEFLRLKFSNE